jgi:hypothetical protein
MKIEIDREAIYDFLQTGGWIELPVKGAKKTKFFLNATQSESNVRVASSGKTEVGDWDTIIVSGLETKTGLSVGFDVFLDLETYRIVLSQGSSYLFYMLDSDNMPSSHGTGPYKALPGGPPMPVPPKSTWPDDVKPIAPINIRIGIMVTSSGQAQASAESLNLAVAFDQRLKTLNDSLADGNINVRFVVAGQPGTIGVTEANKTLFELLTELNGPAPIRADVASFRLQTNSDIVVAAVASSAFPAGIAYGAGEGGYALIRGNASQSTLLMTIPTLKLETELAHEVGHLLGAEHTINDRQQTTPNSPNFG